MRRGRESRGEARPGRWEESEREAGEGQPDELSPGGPVRPPIGRERVAQSDIGDGGDAEKPPSAPARRGTGAPGAAPRGALRPPGLLPRAARQVSSTFRSKLRPLSALGPVPQGTAGQGRAAGLAAPGPRHRAPFADCRASGGRIRPLLRPARRRTKDGLTALKTAGAGLRRALLPRS